MIDLAGEQFGRLTVLRLAARRYGQTRRRVGWVRCAGNAVVLVPVKSLTCGKSRSCGCLRRENSSARARAKQRSATGQFICVTIGQGMSP